MTTFELLIERRLAPYTVSKPLQPKRKQRAVWFLKPEEMRHYMMSHKMVTGGWHYRQSEEYIAASRARRFAWR